MELTCACCGYSHTFTDGQEAFKAGWDAPPRFKGYVTCNLCPGAFVILGMTSVHDAAHERWADDGRPASFEESMLKGDVPPPGQIRQ